MSPDQYSSAAFTVTQISHDYIEIAHVWICTINQKDKCTCKFVNTNICIMLLGLPYDPFHDEDADESPQQHQQKLHQKLQQTPAKPVETPEKVETKEETIKETEVKKKVEESEKVSEETEQDGERLGERVAKIEDFTGKVFFWHLYFKPIVNFFRFQFVRRS